MRDMGKSLRISVVSVALLLLPAVAARAATVIVLVDGTGAFTIQNSLSVGIGAIDLVVTGATGFTPNPLNTGVSPLDTAFVLDSAGPGLSALVVNNPANGISIAPAGQTSLIGTFARVADPLAFTLIPGDDFFGGTLFDPDLNLLHPTSTDAQQIICGEPPCTGVSYQITFQFVPEPALIALAVAALALLAARKRML